MPVTNLEEILVTGGAGFIGSSLIPVLLDKGYRVTVLDHLSKGNEQKINQFLSFSNCKFIQTDLLDQSNLRQVINNCDLIFHLAANVEVRQGQFDTATDFQNNIVATRNLLEHMRTSERCKKIIFTSSSVVYGEAQTIPTPEDYGPLKPISLYGASKLAGEALISGYVGMFGIDAVIFRLANIVGPTSTHGVVPDFLAKLSQTGNEYLEVLGDGNQKKSYLYIDDCINALMLGLDQISSGLEIFNVGSDDQIDTNTVARTIIDALGLQKKIRYVTEQRDGRGWLGDVKNMLLSTERLKRTGWKITYTSNDSISQTVRKVIEKATNLRK